MVYDNKDFKKDIESVVLKYTNTYLNTMAQECNIPVKRVKKIFVESGDIPGGDLTSTGMADRIGEWILVAMTQ